MVPLYIESLQSLPSAQWTGSSGILARSMQYFHSHISLSPNMHKGTYLFHGRKKSKTNTLKNSTVLGESFKGAVGTLNIFSSQISIIR